MRGFGFGGRAGGGQPARAKVVTQIVPSSSGPVYTLPRFGLLPPVTFAKQSGSSNLSLNASSGAIAAATAITVGASQSIAGTVTGADGCVIPFSVTLTGQPDVVPPTITSTNPSGTYAENAAIGGTLTANETVTWGKIGADAGLVTLNTSTGVWSLAPTNWESGKISYSWSFSATDAAGNQTVQTVSIALTNAAEPPAAPTMSLNASDGQVSVAWTDNSFTGPAITAHQIYGGNAPGSLSLLATVTGASPFTDTGLTNGSPRYYRVSAVNSDGESALAAEQSATPSAIPPWTLGAGIWNDGLNWDDAQNWKDAA